MSRLPTDLNCILDRSKYSEEAWIQNEKILGFLSSLKLVEPQFVELLDCLSERPEETYSIIRALARPKETFTKSLYVVKRLFDQHAQLSLSMHQGLTFHFGRDISQDVQFVTVTYTGSESQWVEIQAAIETAAWYMKVYSSTNIDNSEAIPGLVRGGEFSGC